MKTEAYRCTWDSWVPQYHDDSDPMPAKWDDPPDEVVALVFKIDAESLIDAARARAETAEGERDALQARIDDAPVGQSLGMVIYHDDETIAARMEGKRVALVLLP